VVDFLFLGLGPISRNLIKKFSFQYPSRKILFLSSADREAWWPDNVSKTNSEEILSSNVSYNFIINSWKNLDDDKLNLLARFKQLDLDESYFVNFSTVGVYGNHNTSVHEESSCLPINFYGQTKRNIEINLKNLGLNNLINLRISNIFGDPGFQDFINLSIAAQMKSENIRVVEPTKIYRDFLHVEQLVRYLDSLIILISQNPDPWKGYIDLNIASGVSLSLQNIIDRINHFSGLSLDVTLISRNANVIERSHVNTSRLHGIFPQLLPDVNQDLDSYIKTRFDKIN
jgi:hypothetical protein